MVTSQITDILSLKQILGFPTKADDYFRLILLTSPYFASNDHYLVTVDTITRTRLTCAMDTKWLGTRKVKTVITSDLHNEPWQDIYDELHIETQMVMVWNTGANICEKHLESEHPTRQTADQVGAEKRTGTCAMQNLQKR